MGINENKRHKKGESGRAWGYKCVIMVLSNNKDKRFDMSLFFVYKIFNEKNKVAATVDWCFFIRREYANY